MAAIRRLLIITAVLAVLLPGFNWSAHAQATVDLYLTANRQFYRATGLRRLLCA